MYTKVCKELEKNAERKCRKRKCRTPIHIPIEKMGVVPVSRTPIFSAEIFMSVLFSSF